MPSELLRNATLVEFQPSRVETGDLRVRDGRIVERGKNLPVIEGEPALDLSGRVVMPGLVCAHTHLYSALARGMPGPRQAPRNFVEILEQVWWRLDRALDPEIVYLSALVGAIDAVRSGATCLIDHHSSPGAAMGSLGAIRRALGTVGLRGILCYEISDRGGRDERDRGLEETRTFLAEDSGDLIRGMVGAHASFTLGTDSLEAIGSMAAEFGVGVHIHTAEDLADVDDARTRYGHTVVERLAMAGCLTPKTILAHGTHLSAEELAIVRDSQAWLVHNPRSNMNNRVGHAPVSDFGPRAALGTDGIGADMLEEAKVAFFKAQDAGADLSPDHVLRLLSGGTRLAGESFGIPLGTLAEGAAADLVVLDYRSPTPFGADNLAGHVLFGMSSAHVHCVMVAGKWVMLGRQFPGIDLDDLAARAREAAARLWTRMQTVPELAWAGVV